MIIKDSSLQKKKKKKLFVNQNSDLDGFCVGTTLNQNTKTKNVNKPTKNIHQ